MRKVFSNIKELVQVRPKNIAKVAGRYMQTLPIIKDAFLLIENGRILEFGQMKDYIPDGESEVIDVTGQLILPTWCDSHTHIVFAGNREDEFVDRIHGYSYEEIARRGGGILNSAKLLQAISEDDLYRQSAERVREVMQMGTGALEIKSGYGLIPAAELKMLQVTRSLQEKFPLPIKSTLLAAHAVPIEFRNRKEDYLRVIAEELIPEVANKQLAEFVDVFCEKEYFSTADTALILDTAKKYGLIPKIHVNQFNAIGGVQVGVEYHARSVDHLEIMRAEDISTLKGTSTMPVALPGCSFYVGIPYTPARQMIDAGLPLALASDFNPGSAPSGNMNFVVATASIKMQMTPAESINAATINGAYAMGLEKEVGSITRGKRANLILTNPVNSYGTLAYAFGSHLIDKVYIDGNPL